MECVHPECQIPKLRAELSAYRARVTALEAEADARAKEYGRRYREVSERLELSCRDWADAHSHAQRVAMKWYPEATVLGDSNGVPPIETLVDLIAERAERAEKRRDVRPWPDETIMAVAALEMEHGIEVVSMEHHQKWVECTERAEAKVQTILKVLAEVVVLADAAMIEANADGAEYDREGELDEALTLLNTEAALRAARGEG